MAALLIEQHLVANLRRCNSTMNLRGVFSENLTGPYSKLISEILGTLSPEVDMHGGHNVEKID